MGDNNLWWMLAGAMLANQSIKEQGLKCLDQRDTPKEVRPLWAALLANNRDEVWNAMAAVGLPDERSGGKAILGVLISLLQKNALDAFMRAQMARVEFQKINDADTAASTLESIAAQIRARQAALEKPAVDSRQSR